MRTALTIAGSDPTGGAGIQADLRTFAANDVVGISAITAITVQNHRGVREVVGLAPALVAAQIDAVAEEREIDATKIGMLATGGILDAVVAAIERHRLRKVVLDPIVTATAGGQLLEPAAIARLAPDLFHLVDVVTPNVDEARTITGLEIHDVDGLRAAAARIIEIGARSVVVTGGHLPGDPVDVVYDGHSFTELPGTRLSTGRTHGTGCAFSSALAARLAHGDSLVDAARAAKGFVRSSLMVNGQ